MLHVGLGFGLLLPCAISATTTTVAPSAPIRMPLISALRRACYGRSASAGLLRNPADCDVLQLDAGHRSFAIHRQLLELPNDIDSLDNPCERRVFAIEHGRPCKDDKEGRVAA